MLMPLTAESLSAWSVLVCLVEVKTLARVILAALWFVTAYLSALCPGDWVAHWLITLEFTQILRLSAVGLLNKLACHVWRWCNQMSLRVQENLRSDVKEIINWLHIIQGRKFTSLLLSPLVPKRLSFNSVLEKPTAEPVCRIHKGFFIKMSVKFKYYYITTYINTLSKLYMIYIVLSTEHFTASLINIPGNVILHTLALFVLM